MEQINEQRVNLINTDFISGGKVLETKQEVVYDNFNVKIFNIIAHKPINYYIDKYEEQLAKILILLRYRKKSDLFNLELSAIQKVHFNLKNLNKFPKPTDKLYNYNDEALLSFFEIDKKYIIPQKDHSSYSTLNVYGPTVWLFMHYFTLAVLLHNKEETTKSTYAIISNLELILLCSMCVNNYKNKNVFVNCVIPNHHLNGSPAGCMYMIHNIVNIALKKEILQENVFNQIYDTTITNKDYILNGTIKIQQKI